MRRSDNETTKTAFTRLSGRQRDEVSAAIRSGISRRDFLAYAGAAGMTAAAAGQLFLGARAAQADTPSQGGTIRCALSDYGTDTMDPQLFSSTGDFTRGRAHFNNLVQLDESLTPQAELAEAFEANADATEWTFRLREGVTFHDGSPMTADDVVWSMNRHIGEETASKAKVLFSAVKEWRKIDNTTVKAELSAPNSDLASILGTFHFKVLKEGESNFANPLGTGPYRMAEYEPGIRSIHTRNEDYWREPPKPDQIELFAIADDSARLSALMSGDAEMVTNLDPKAVPMVQNTDGVTVWSVPSGSYTCIICMTNTGPGSDPNFVLGLKHLLNRERTLAFSQGGMGTIGNDQPINAAYAEYAEAVTQRAFDPDKARHYLQKSGVTSAEIQVPNFGEDMVLLLQQEAKQVGFDLQVKKVPSDGYWSSVWMKTPLHVSDWFMRPTANIMMSLAFAPDAKWNESQWINERFGQLLKEDRATTDRGLKAELHREMQQLVTDEAGVLIPSHRNIVDGISERITGLTRNPLGSLGGCEWPEFVAFKA